MQTQRTEVNLMFPYRELTLWHKPAFDPHFLALQPDASDLTFTNLFMWQHSYGLHVYYLESLDYWILLSKPRNWPSFFLPPVGDWNHYEKLKEVLQVMRVLAEEQRFSFRLRRIPRQLMEAINSIDQSIRLEPELRTFDYVYRTSDLINLAGRKYHAKRNFVNRFQRLYQSEFLPLTPEIAAHCLELKEPWLNLARPEEELESEDQAIISVLQNFSSLGVKGGVMVIDGKIQALTVGETLNATTAVIHIEKANTEFEGIYAAINQLCSSRCWMNLPLINREEDLGLEGLRQSKLSYHPIRMVEKFQTPLTTV